MRKIILLFTACLFSFQGIHAQNSSNVNHLNLCVGALYERGFDATLSYEHETKYHHSWEYFANAYIQYDTDPDAGHIGFEHSYDFRRGWSLFWQVKEDIVLRGEDLFRTGVTVGVKFPL